MIIILKIYSQAEFVGRGGGRGHFNLIFITILWFIFSNITIIGLKCSSSLTCKSSIEVNNTCNLNRVLHFVIISRVCGAF